MFFLRKLNHFNIDSCKILLQSVLSFGLIGAFGNVHIQDQKKLQQIVEIVSRIVGVNQIFVAQLFNDLTLKTDALHGVH